jgi:glycosyltransferase involved in cell wall biosynthesis
MTCQTKSVIMQSTELNDKLVACKSVSVVIPVYNSAQSLPILIDRLKSVLAGACRKYEVILVNDGSNDESWDVIVSLAKSFPWLYGISLARNSVS